MARKINKKIKKQPKPKPLTIRPKITQFVNLKRCTDCGNKNGQGYAIPLGYLDRLGAQREIPNVTNINVNHYIEKRPELIPLSTIGTQTIQAGKKVKSPSKFEDRLESALGTPRTVSFGLETPLSVETPNIENATLRIVNTPRQANHEGQFTTPKSFKTSNQAPETPLSAETPDIENMTLRIVNTPRQVNEDEVFTAPFNPQSGKAKPRRGRISNKDKYADLLINNGERENVALELARSTPKRQLRGKIEELKQSLKKI